MENFKFSPDQQQVLDFLHNSDGSSFTMGLAGTGKTEIHKRFVAETENVIVVAPTGIAALTAGGATIHRTFGWSHKTDLQNPPVVKKVRKLMPKVEAIVVDEISMVRADLLSAMDIVLRRVLEEDQPFGGMRIVSLGDFSQLPPVVPDEDQQLMQRLYGTAAGWCFAAPCYRELNPRVFFLRESFRQADDSAFADALNGIRVRDPNAVVLINEMAAQNAARNPDFRSYVPAICTHLYMVQRYNEQGLRRLNAPTKQIKPTIDGDERRVPKEAKETLELAIGARVMITRNGNGYVNGSTGSIERFNLPMSICVRLDSGHDVNIGRVKYETIVYEFDEELDKVIPKVVATSYQFPIMLGYAVTVHKSQGQSLDHALIDFSSGAFAAGHAYTALSRLRTSAGLYLARPLSIADVIIDPLVSQFFGGYDPMPAPQQLPPPAAPLQALPMPMPGQAQLPQQAPLPGQHYPLPGQVQQAPLPGQVQPPQQVPLPGQVQPPQQVRLPGQQPPQYAGAGVWPPRPTQPQQAPPALPGAPMPPGRLQPLAPDGWPAWPAWGDD